MDLNEALTTTGAVRTFTSAPVERAVIARILDAARFAPSGGNKQSWRVAVVEDAALRARLHELTMITAREYLALSAAGQRAFGLTQRGRWPGPGDVDLAAARQATGPSGVFDGLASAPVMLVVASEIGLIAALDAELDRHGIVAGASIYPFCWSILLAARAERLGGVLTTFAVRQEPEVLALLDAPAGYAISAVIYLGHPQHQPRRLSRHPVESFATLDTFTGPPLRP